MAKVLALPSGHAKEPAFQALPDCPPIIPFEDLEIQRQLRRARRSQPEPYVDDLDRDAARERSLSVLGGPVKRVMKMMFKGALRSDQEWEAFHSLIETLGGEDVDRAADDSRSRRLLKEASVQEDKIAQGSSGKRASKVPGGSTEPAHCPDTPGKGV